MKTTFWYGSAPADEDCSQIEHPGYDRSAQKECYCYIEQMKRDYEKAHSKPLPEGVQLRVKSNSHDFGTYYEVTASVEESDHEAMEAAFWLDGNASTTWDDISVQKGMVRS